MLVRIAMGAVTSSLILSSDHQWRSKCDFHCFKVIKAKVREDLPLMIQQRKEKTTDRTVNSSFFPEMAKGNLLEICEHDAEVARGSPDFS